jgi:hypothetical protein
MVFHKKKIYFKSCSREQLFFFNKLQNIDFGQLLTTSSHA